MKDRKAEERNLFLDFKENKASDLSILLCARGKKSLVAMKQEMENSDLDLLLIYKELALKEDSLRQKREQLRMGSMFSLPQLVAMYAAFLFICVTAGLVASVLITLIVTRGLLEFSPVFASAFILLGIAFGTLGMIALLGAIEKEAFSDIGLELEYISKAKEVLSS